MAEELLGDAAAATPDPERALKNLLSFIEANPRHAEELNENVHPVALLFSISQFLANFSSSMPSALFDAVRRIATPLDQESIRSLLLRDMGEEPNQTKETLMEVLRVFKKKMLLWVTLRDITGTADIAEGMQELSFLADVLVQESLTIIRRQMRESYGEPEQDAFTILSVGKLGSHELNFSSDIDLLYVYGIEQGETTGVVTPAGMVKNRISNHEYYSKLGEGLNKFLSLNTGNGFLYRVDLRLRPEGQRGSLAMSLPAYEIYYESWGKAWERAMLLRARPVAGDAELGREFLEMVRPFVYRKYLDYTAIREIRQMKSRIDEKFKKDDIKRGYGGIREIEFFTQALLLIYGGREPLLRESNTLKALHLLFQKNLIGPGDFSELGSTYCFLRKLEHRLQQLNDLQTHTIPSGESELASLGRKMAYPDRESFLAALDTRRKGVRRIYDSLFTEDERPRRDEKMLLFFSEELSEPELQELLTPYALKETGKAMRNIQHIKDSAISFQTLRGQRLLNDILPLFLHEALVSANPDAALNNLQSFAAILSSEESYLNLFARHEELVAVLVQVFSQSEYLSRTIMKRLEYLELLGHEMYSRKTLSLSRKELSGRISAKQSLPESIRVFKQMEEIRLGILFLDKKIDICRLMNEISKIADAIVWACLQGLAFSDGLTVVGFGKAGGRELTFGSDLDLVFTCDRSVTGDTVRAAERFMRFLISYTKDGIAYNVDTRLRPDGTRGPLVSPVTGFADYYEKSAHFWEFQALLKARPMAGDGTAARNFMGMREDVLKARGGSVKATDIRAMRDRIQKELVKEVDGYDIKLGPGGLEELEFTVQYLQLKHCRDHPGLLVPGTHGALRRLITTGIIGEGEGRDMRAAYLSYRTVESLLRLRGETALRRDESTLGFISEFMGFERGEDFLESLGNTRSGVEGLFEKYLV